MQGKGYDRKSTECPKSNLGGGKSKFFPILFSKSKQKLKSKL